MKRKYESPALLVERFDLTQTLSNCTVMIGFTDLTCILMDKDATPKMKEFAIDGFFTDKIPCSKYLSDRDHEDGLCYHTSVNLVFSS